MKRILFAVVMTLALTATLIAQRGRGGLGGPPWDTATALKDALGLTDAQVEAIKALGQAEQTRIQAIQNEIGQKRQALDALLNATAPNAVDVGNAAIALHASESKLQAERISFINQIKQQLTGDQQQKLDALLAANGGRSVPLSGLGPGPGGRGPRGGGSPQ